MGLLTTQSLCFQIAVGKREGTLQSRRRKPVTWDLEANVPPTARPAQPDGEGTSASTAGETASAHREGQQDKNSDPLLASKGHSGPGREMWTQAREEGSELGRGSQV